MHLIRQFPIYKIQVFNANAAQVNQADHLIDQHARINCQLKKYH